MRTTAVVIAFASLAACASDLRDPIDDSDGGAQDLDAGIAPLVETTELGGGASETRINSSDQDAWIHVSLATGAVAAIDESAGELAWDLGFRRFNIKLNGGASGAGAGELALIDGAALDDVSEAPAGGYVTDEPDVADDEDEDDEYAFLTAGDGWFDYDPMTHVLTPKERVYVVRGAEGATFALSIQRYYDEAGSAARFTVHWAPI